ncbi:hypothetical protein DMB38_07415 [Streptomyces sp. WAC 06738]|uniref:hypothetical protein n=1 Tax=Streptomyces sp. WAC 06738 TaxID=2203210 RepID=UPI000F6C8187|nr:hypothetical protein [Streptomyces sp. WAC 06738]AZM45685.1 hypothetical protein DMB38_07415 [Streptomyces sp. WAC 06738]
MPPGQSGRRLLLTGLAAPLLWAAVTAPAEAVSLPAAPRAAASVPVQEDAPHTTGDGKNPGRAPAMGSPGAPAVRGDDAWPAITASGVFAVSLGAAVYFFGWGRRRTA